MYYNIGILLSIEIRWIKFEGVPPVKERLCWPQGPGDTVFISVPTGTGPVIIDFTLDSFSCPIVVFIVYFLFHLHGPYVFLDHVSDALGNVTELTFQIQHKGTHSNGSSWAQYEETIWKIWRSNSQIGIGLIFPLIFQSFVIFLRLLFCNSIAGVTIFFANDVFPFL